MKITSIFCWGLLIFSSLSIEKSLAQNLVPNPGFEFYDSLPCNFIQSNIEFGQYIQNWFLPTGGTSDIISTQIPSTCDYGNPLSFQSCGPQYARSGDAMVGMVAESFYPYEEYIEVQLLSPLIQNKHYYFECYIMLGICSNFASNNYGAAFSVNNYSDTLRLGNILLQPLVIDSTIQNNTMSWNKISGCFVADSTYQYLILGHFPNICESSELSSGAWPMTYYFIDDVYLVEDSTCEQAFNPCLLADNIYIRKNNDKLKWYVEFSYLNISKENFLGTLTIFNSIGKKILFAESFENSISIDLHSFAQGIYVCVLQDEKNNVIHPFKFVKN